ncbi:MAG: LysM peptidoglycan-binding domain-containing protein [Burkholderiales bacterium]
MPTNARTSICLLSQSRIIRNLMAGLASAALLGMPLVAATQDLPISAAQKATAAQVAQAGVPLNELAPNAPDTYTIKNGDTLWAISRLFLASPWRWPELWGLNQQEIRNPHRIYPGQVLVLEKKNGLAQLRVASTGNTSRGETPPTETVRVSPRVRSESLADAAVPTLQASQIEPFLDEPVIVELKEFEQAPRVVATLENRVILSRGDRAYARGTASQPLIENRAKPTSYRLFREATPLKDPLTGVVLGYEARFIGRALLVRGESTVDTTINGKTLTEIVPATIDIVDSKEEIRVGDRLLPEPPRQFKSYAPRAPRDVIQANVVSVFGGTAVRFAAQNQIVVINRGTQDGLEVGHVLATLLQGQRLVDTTDAARTPIKLPNERSGLLMVFRPFERLSYALILEGTEPIQSGDVATNPR